ncbi:MAG: methyl-accepting chemotaxis protein [Bryobacterales bacterium]|nr:methyl-accepting chemotaxis protein [Bryobacterales bacterium]
MKDLRNIGLKTKLYAGCAAGVAAAIVIGLVGHMGMSRMETAMNQALLMARVIQNHMDADMMHDALRGDVLAMLAASSRVERDEVRRDMAEHGQRFQQNIEENLKLPLQPDSHQALLESKTLMEAYISAANMMADLANRDAGFARSKMPEFRKAFSALEQQMETVSERLEKENEESGKAAGQAAGNARLMAALTVVIATILLAVASTAAIRGILGPLNQVLAGLARMEQGDLRHTLNLAGKDEMAQLANAHDGTAARLREMLHRVQAAAVQMETATKNLVAMQNRVADNSTSTADQASQVSASSEEVSASVGTVAANSTEMAASIREIAARTNESAILSRDARSAAQHAKDQAAHLTTSATEINTALVLITEIANQTKLLALNASIEAARAGQAGRGFNVVAQEVGDLALNSMKTAQDIAARVGNIQSDATNMLRAVEDITTLVARIDSAGEAIAAAVEQQSASTAEIERTMSGVSEGSGQIARSVVEVARTAQQNADMVSQAKSETTGLEQMAAELNSVLAGFKL